MKKTAKTKAPPKRVTWRDLPRDVQRDLAAFKGKMPAAAIHAWLVRLEKETEAWTKAAYKQMMGKVLSQAEFERTLSPSVRRRRRALGMTTATTTKRRRPR